MENVLKSILLGLKDVDWIALRDIEEEVHLPKEKTRMLLDFRSYPRFITIDDKIGNVRINHFGEMLLGIQSPNS